MTTDTSERGLERLICTALTGTACDPVAASANRVRERPPPYGAGWICGAPEDYDREYASTSRSSPPSCARRSRTSSTRSTWRTTARRGASSSPACRARSRKRGVIDVLRQGHQARPAPLRPLLRHALAGQRQGRRTLQRQPLQRHAPAPLQPGRDAARARPVPVHQRPAHRHLRAEEQPDQADGRGRRRAVQARPRPARAAVRVRPLRRALRGGRPRGAHLHAAEGQGLVVPALQPGLERRRRQSAQPGRPEDRLPLEAHPHAGGPDRHPRELRPDRRGRRTRRPARRSAVQIFPRYHQLDVVRKLLADAQAHGAGKRYLIQHSAGSGKSNSIAWLAHQLIGLKQGRARRSSTRSSSSPTGASSTSRSATRSSSSRRWARRSATPSTRATCASSSQRARRSSSRRCRSSRSSSTRSAASTAGDASPSSSTRRTRARAARPPRR